MRQSSRHRTGIVCGTGPSLNRVHGTAVVNNGTCYRGAGFPGDGTSIVEDAAVYGKRRPLCRRWCR